MDKTIARLNIEHYHHALLDEKDETKRRMLLRLLAEEKEKLKALVSSAPQETQQH